MILVDPEGSYVTEEGEILRPEEITGAYRCFCSWETARRLTTSGRGEALLWNGEHIRWRPRQFRDEDEWKPRPFDAYVLRVPMYPENESNLREIARWRDWLYEYRAIPGTMGGTSMSLLKSRLKRPLYCSSQWDMRRIRQSAGGIIRNGPGGPGVYEGKLVHWDMPAAYATEIGTMRYGGRWFYEKSLAANWLSHLVSRNVPVFVRARVYVPKGFAYGPLPSRPATPIHPLKALLLMYSGERYPTGKYVQGIWTWEEVRAAIEAGCSVKLIEAWKHSAPEQSPFTSWFSAVQEGREMQGLAGLLAKTTGNALWGSFALDPSIRGKRSIHYRVKGKRKIQVRRPRARGYPLPAIDLAETVAGRVRARLFTAMRELGDSLVCAHTDGLWSLDTGQRFGDGWRPKERARRIELLTPQALRYYTSQGEQVTYSGVPAERAPESFAIAWNAFTDREEE